MDPECVIITSKLVLLVIIAAKNLISKHKKIKCLMLWNMVEEWTLENGKCRDKEKGTMEDSHESSSYVG